MTICWLDIETTGLDPRCDSILEIGAILTDDALEEVDRFHVVANGAYLRRASDIDPAVIDMHTASGLWEAPHRAMADLENSIGLYRYYLSHLTYKDRP